MKMARVFGVSIIDSNLKELLEYSLRPGVYVFANAASWVSFCENVSLKSVFRRARGVFADGVGTLIAGKIQGVQITHRNPGPDFTDQALKAWSNEPMGFVGGSREGLEILKKKYSLSKTLQYIPPHREFSVENAEQDSIEFEKLTLSEGINPQIVWVVLGCPKQELWADTVFKLHSHRRYFCVGAAFDFLTEQKKRAPEWMRQTGLEWLHRFISEPSRLWERYLIGNLKLMIYAFLERKNNV